MSDIPILYSPRQIALVRASGMVLAAALRLAGSSAKPGVTTREIDKLVGDSIRSAGGLPVFLGYVHGDLPPFPSSICSSVNDVVIHGIPDDTPLVEGDLLSIDIGVRKDGYVADAAWTFPVGKVDDTAERLLRVAREALDAGIAAARPRGCVSDVSRAIQEMVESAGFTLVREFCGHGVGHSLHEAPNVPNFVDPKSPKVILKEGMIFAIEPMVNEGTAATSWPKGQWIVRTSDGKRSVHFEHTVALVSSGAEVLTN